MPRPQSVLAGGIHSSGRSFGARLVLVPLEEGHPSFTTKFGSHRELATASCSCGCVARSGRGAVSDQPRYLSATVSRLDVRGRVALVAPTARRCGTDVTRARWCRISGGQMIRGRDAAIAPKHRVAFITGLNRHRASPPCHVHVRTVVQHRRRSAGPAEHFVRFPNVCGRLASVLCSGSLQLLTRPLRHGDNFAHAITRVPNNRITRLH